jgi:cysteine desulfurase
VASDLPIYLDHHATTPLDPRVLAAMEPYFGADFGNASSESHVYGWRARAAVDLAREQIAAAIGADDPATIAFTSGTTESDNLALAGLAKGYAGQRDHLIASTIEHPAVLDTCRALEADGCTLTLLPVDSVGRVDPADVEAAIGDRTLVVSVMAANSEIGVLQALDEIGAVCARRGVFFHSDAAQALGKIPVDVDRWGVDLLSMCAHKLYGPKGIGALYLRTRRPRMRVRALIHGGGHERGLRSGTLPVALIVGFARAVELCLEDLDVEAARQAGLRDALWERLQAGLEGVSRNGDPDHALPGNLSVRFEGVDADALMLALPDIALSSGSACASGSGEPSHVLAALGLSASAARGCLRFGLGRSTTPEQIDQVALRLIEAVTALRAGAGRPARTASGRGTPSA